MFKLIPLLEIDQPIFVLTLEIPARNTVKGGYRFTAVCFRIDLFLLKKPQNLQSSGYLLLLNSNPFG